MAAKKKSGEGVPWALIVALFIFGLWPIALVILLVKLFGKDGKAPQQAAPPLTAEPVRAAGAGSRKRSAASKVTRSPAPKETTAKRLKIIGGIVLAVGLLACWPPVDMMLWLGEIENYYIEDLLQALAVAVAGGALLGSGVSMSRSLKRYHKYLIVMGDREAIATEELARTLGYDRKQVEKDLQKMLDKGYFGGKAYLNVELGYLFRTSEADAQLRREQAQAKANQAPKEAEKGYSGILREIRRANDEIADPVLSAKIDRLEQIAGRIFKLVEEDPSREQKIASFFNYYLPTTQKLLDSYAKFESAGIEGENLRQAKARIESTMDAIVRGFEYQLDELYKADAMDVDRDIRVMETMLHRDTATVEEDFGLHQQEGQ